MTHPYQCITICKPDADNQSNWILFGACGPHIVTQSSSGAVSVWPPKKEKVSVNDQETELQEPPSKKVKLLETAEELPNVTKLAVSRDNQHLVAATAEDKSIRVFHINRTGHLELLNQRPMPKRPCAVIFSPDNSTILCADKFGDVYALPLLVSPDESEAVPPLGQKKDETSQKPFKPAATSLTVHSGRNRKVLEDQMKQSKQQPKTKEPMRFKHEILLGHVSMLTDILFATINAQDPTAKARNYLLTADRDEHIRISRGPPQSHIIEGFCQGHKEFVSKLCLTKPRILISGGGDDYLFVWDWLNCSLLEKISIKEPVLDFFKEHPQHDKRPEDHQQEFKVAVCGLWAIPTETSKKNEGLLVACEGIPALFYFQMGREPNASKLCHTIPLLGNPLDLALLRLPSNEYLIFLSIDHVHEPGSTTAVRLEADIPSRLQIFSVNTNGDVKSACQLDDGLQWFSRQAPTSGTGEAEVEDRGDIKVGAQRVVKDEKIIRDMLYGVENLRKRAEAEE
ncbi:hypothetical protein K432DRAFT_352869, partial [Lepidopterella palustris CBS 459.81]